MSPCCLRPKFGAFAQWKSQDPRKTPKFLQGLEQWYSMLCTLESPEESVFKFFIFYSSRSFYTTFEFFKVLHCNITLITQFFGVPLNFSPTGFPLVQGYLVNWKVFLNPRVNVATHVYYSRISDASIFKAPWSILIPL